MILDIIKVVSIGLGFLLFSGWGIGTILLPDRLHRRAAFPLMPLIGLAMLDAVGHGTSLLVLPAKHSIWIALFLACVLNAAALLLRRDRIRLPSRPEVMIGLFAMPALLLALSPMLAADQLLPLGIANGDPVAHATTTEFLKDNTFLDEVPASLEYAVFTSTFDKMKRFVRLGFHFYQAYVDLLSAESAYATYSIVSAVGTYLWAVAVGFYGWQVLRLAMKMTYLATGLFALSALPLWISFGGYGPQSLGMGLLVSGLGAWALALKQGGWRHAFLAAILSAGLAGIYSEALVYLVLPTGLLTAVLLITDQTRRWQIVKAGLLTVGLTLLFSPVSWARAGARMFDLRPRIVLGSTGGVNWFIDPRQITGVIPFSEDVDRWYGSTVTSILWLPVALLAATVVYGFIQLKSSSKVIIISVILPQLATVLWFAFRAESYPYGYFKAWSMGWWVYVLLLAVGLIKVTSLATGRHRILLATMLVASLAGLFLAASLFLSRDVSRSLPLSSATVEAASWAYDVDVTKNLYVAPGEMKPLSTFWLAHLLRDRPTKFATRLIYTKFGPGEPYRGELFVLRHTSSADDWDEGLWTESTIQQNQEFELLALEAAGGRDFLLPDPDNPLAVTIGDQFRLLGYDAISPNLTAGGELSIILYWQAITGTDTAFKVFIHLIDENGQLVAQYDGHPRDWTYFTYLWQPGEVVKDEYVLTLPVNLTPGQYHLLTGLYLPETGERLPVIQDDQPGENNSAVLDTVTIGPVIR